MKQRFLMMKRNRTSLGEKKGGCPGFVPLKEVVRLYFS